MQNAIGGVVTRASKDVQLHAAHMRELIAIAIVWLLFVKPFAVCGAQPMHRYVVFSSLVALRQDLARWATEVP